MSETNAELLERIKVLAGTSEHFDDLQSLIEQVERAQKLESELVRLKEKERIYQIGDTHYREKVKPLKYLFPLENTPGIGQIVGKIQEQLEENKRLRDALDFYADSENYEVNVVDQWGPEIKVMMDGGAKAAELLEGMK